MKTYLAIAKATWQEYFTYRMNFFLEVIGGFVMNVVIIAVWFAIYRDNGNETIGEFSLAEMITYLIGVGIINSFILLASQGDEINDDINKGNLSNLLVRPINVLFYWLTRDVCRRSLTLMLGIGQYIFLLVLFSEYITVQSSFSAFIYTLIFILLGGIFHFLLFSIFSIVAFWMDQTWGLRFVIRIVMSMASGSLIPLSLFSGAWFTVFNILPFKFFAFVPLEIYLGHITTREIYSSLFIIGGWIAISAFILFVLWKRGIRRYGAYGH